MGGIYADNVDVLRFCLDEELHDSVLFLGKA